MESNISPSFKDPVLRRLVSSYLVDSGPAPAVEGRMAYKSPAVMAFDVFLIGEMVIIFILYVCCLSRSNC